MMTMMRMHLDGGGDGEDNDDDADLVESKVPSKTDARRSLSLPPAHSRVRLLC